MTLDRHDCFNVDVRSPTRNESFAQTFSKYVLQIHASFVRRGVSQSVEECEKLVFTLLKQEGVPSSSKPPTPRPSGPSPSSSAPPKKFGAAPAARSTLDVKEKERIVQMIGELDENHQSKIYEIIEKHQPTLLSGASGSSECDIEVWP